MTYQHKLIDGKWFILSDDGETHGPYASGIDVARALSKLRQGYTATTVATLTRKQAARKDYREALGK